MKHIVSRMSSYFPNRWPLSYLNLTKNMKTYIRRQHVETMSRRRVDLCCLKETRRKREGVQQIVGKDSRFKLFWSGNDKGTGCVGILLAEEWWENVFEVVRVSDRIILIRMTIGKTVFVFVCVYAPQANLSDIEKDRFYKELQSTVHS